MRLHLLAVLLLALVAGARAADPPARPASAKTPAGAGTNVVMIVGDDGFWLTTNHVVFQKNVRAADPQMYLECEQLTARFSSKSTNAPKSAAAGSSASYDPGDIDLVIAETNVMIITAQMQIIGDRAVYSAADDLLTVTGQLVVALNAQGSFVGTNIVYNRRSDEVFGNGPITTIISGSFTRSNAPPAVPTPK